MSPFAFPAKLSNRPYSQAAARRRFGLGLCALSVLAVACSGSERDFSGAGGTGGSPDGGGSAGASASGGSGGSSGGSGGTGGSTGGTGATAGMGSGGMAGISGAGGAGCTTTDPNCECVNGVVQAKDVDMDGEGSKDCAAAPGTDCNDNDLAFQQNACGGCMALPGNPGAACGQCGTWACNGMEALNCTVGVPAPTRCGNSTTPEVCVNGSWVAQAGCTGTLPKCLSGKCVQCTPGTFKCETCCSGSDTIIKRCLSTGSWESSWSTSCFAAQGKHCNAATGTCTSALDPLDLEFEVQDPSQRAPARRRGPGSRSVQEVLDLASGLELA